MIGALLKTSQVLALEKAIQHAGGVNALAREKGVTHQAIYCWVKKGCLPVDRAIEIERTYGIPALKLVDPKLAACVRSLMGRRQEASCD